LDWSCYWRKYSELPARDVLIPLVLNTNRKCVKLNWKHVQTKSNWTHFLPISQLPKSNDWKSMKNQSIKCQKGPTPCSKILFDKTYKFGAKSTKPMTMNLKVKILFFFFICFTNFLLFYSQNFQTKIKSKIYKSVCVFRSYCFCAAKCTINVMSYELLNLFILDVSLTFFLFVSFRT
jgi:hypothetical protein